MDSIARPDAPATAAKTHGCQVLHTNYKIELIPGESSEMFSNKSLEHDTRSYLENTFWPHIGAGFSFQVLDLLAWVCGLKLALALALNQNPIFKTAYRHSCLLSKFFSSDIKSFTSLNSL